MDNGELNSGPAISAIIISYNTREMTLDCLRTLTAELAGVNSEIFVVDNASTDCSVAAIGEQFPAVRLIANESNRGFGPSNNQAMAVAKGEFFLLLNSDAFPKPGAISLLLEETRKDPAVGMAGPTLLNGKGERGLSPSHFYTPSHVIYNYLWLRSFGFSSGGAPLASTLGPIPPDQFMSGACLLVRREVYETIGGFNERFFFYGDDADWEFRTHKHWKLLFVPDAVVLHLEGGSGNKDRLNYTLCYHEAKELFILMNFGVLAMIGTRICVALGCALRLVRYAGRLPGMLFGRPVFDFPVRLSWHLLLRQFLPRTLNR